VTQQERKKSKEEERRRNRAKLLCTVLILSLLLMANPLVYKRVSRERTVSERSEENQRGKRKTYLRVELCSKVLEVLQLLSKGEALAVE